MPVRVAAVDLGASSGRVMAARVDTGTIELHEVHRFGNGPVPVRGTLHWDVLGLYRGVLEGLRSAGELLGALDSVGIDSWAVDYGLLDGDGALLGNPVHYRDARTDGVLERVVEIVPEAELYARTGMQQLPFNTIYQLVAAAGTAHQTSARHLLLIPDLLGHWLTGELGAEVTNASTTQLLDVRSRTWAVDLMQRVGIDPALFPPLREPGHRLGTLLPAVLEQTGLQGPVPVVAVGSHDTASAVVGVPAERPGFAYISCGTWSLVGLELDAPVLSEPSRRANFSNELGVDGTVRYLRNVMGLWLLQECMRTWHPGGGPSGADGTLEALLSAAAALPALTSVVDVDDRAFLAPGDMPRRIADSCRETGQPVPRDPPQTVRCILDSLALAHRRAVRQAQELSGRHVDVVHVVGGGARNELLCQLTADACGLPVVAGPVESTALGNVLVQARALGLDLPDIPAMRALLRLTQELRRHQPRGSTVPWEHAQGRLVGAARSGP